MYFSSSVTQNALNPWSCSFRGALLFPRPFRSVGEGCFLCLQFRGKHASGPCQFSLQRPLDRMGLTEVHVPPGGEPLSGGRDVYRNSDWILFSFLVFSSCSFMAKQLLQEEFISFQVCIVKVHIRNSITFFFSYSQRREVSNYRKRLTLKYLS